MPKNLQAIVLAGGKSTRFNTGKTKLVEKICGKEMILYPVHLLKKMNIPTTLAVGFQQEKILQILKENKVTGVDFVQQINQQGTGHALSSTKDSWNQDHILVMNGDIPLITEEAIEKLYKKHVKADADISFITSHTADPTNDSYCRIIINNNEIRVIEKQDETVDMEAQCCVSGGIYIMKKSFLEENIDKLQKSAFTKEYYLPELIQIASKNKNKIITSPVSFDIVRGVNTISELWVVEHIRRSQIISYWMNQGVRFAISLNVIIDSNVIIEPGVFIGSGAHLLGNSVVKKDATIGAFSYIKNSVIEESAKIKSHTVITNSTIGQYAIIDPFTQINYQHVLGTPRQLQKKSSPLFTGAVKDDIEMDSSNNL